mmetsp:Transcript_36858/g.96134  ORF Transcript_36858/g.96134 Transcript_36858/m.96134 type:complete len:673 (+) Transcript_36858:274-2292(+)
MSSSCFRWMAACLSTSLCRSSCSILSNSASAVSVGGSPFWKRSRAVSARSQMSSRSLSSLCAVAWCMESSLTVAIIFRVTSLMRAWKALTFWESSMVPCRPSAACFLSLSDSAVTSSRISSFSRRLSFLSFSRSSKSWTFALRVCGSRSPPPSFRHVRSELWGFSSSRDSSSVRLLTLVTEARNRTTSSTSLGTSGMLPLTTCSCLCISFRSTLRARISSLLVAIACSPFFRRRSWMFDFSHRMQSSSFLSISWVPVKFRRSTACSYFLRRLTISLSTELIMEFNLSISMTYCSTRSFSSTPRCTHFVFSCCSWSCWASSFWASCRVRASCLSLNRLSMRRISTSFCRIFSFSFISERCCEDFWICVMYLFLSFLTTSYMVQNSFCFWLISWYFFRRSSSSSAFIATSSPVSRQRRCATDASRASFSRMAASVLKSASLFCSSSFISFSSLCMSSMERVISSYSSFFSFSRDSCFRYAPMKRSTSPWMSSSSLFCRLSSSSCILTSFTRSSFCSRSGGSASSAISLMLTCFLCRRLSRSNCFCACDRSWSDCRHSMLSSSSSWSSSTFCIINLLQSSFSLSSLFLTSSQDWSVILALSVISWRRSVFLLFCSSASRCRSACFLAISLAFSMSLVFSLCCCCSCFTALSNFSACFWMRCGSVLIFLYSASCSL